MPLIYTVSACFSPSVQGAKDAEHGGPTDGGVPTLPGEGKVQRIFAAFLFYVPVWAHYILLLGLKVN
jgi:hypothetical protein